MQIQIGLPITITLQILEYSCMVLRRCFPNGNTDKSKMGWRLIKCYNPNQVALRHHSEEGIFLPRGRRGGRAGWISGDGVSTWAVRGAPFWGRVPRLDKVDTIRIPYFRNVSKWFLLTPRIFFWNGLRGTAEELSRKVGEEVPLQGWGDSVAEAEEPEPVVRGTQWDLNGNRVTWPASPVLFAELPFSLKLTDEFSSFSFPCSGELSSYWATTKGSPEIPVDFSDILGGVSNDTLTGLLCVLSDSSSELGEFFNGLQGLEDFWSGPDGLE